MANFHNDEWILNKVKDHYDEALNFFPEDRIVGIFLQGSQNYGLDYEGSDIDTKLIVVPTFNDIAFNRKAVSTTHIRENEEHIDFKDLRLMLQTFRKQNLNFLEILFTKYKIVNPIYKEDWSCLESGKEIIAHYNLHQAIKSMRGIAKEKYHAMEHRYPSKIEIIDKYGYDPKQLHHLLRVEDYLERYIEGESFEKCLIPTYPEMLKKVKVKAFPLDDAREIATDSINHIDEMCDKFLENTPKRTHDGVDVLLDYVQANIMKKSLRMELNEHNETLF